MTATKSLMEGRLGPAGVFFAGLVLAGLGAACGAAPGAEAVDEDAIARGRVSSYVPWQATLFAGFTPPGSDAPERHYVCGGTIIDPSHVLTAVDCLGAPALQVMVGARDLACGDTVQAQAVDEGGPAAHCATAQIVDVAEVISHEVSGAAILRLSAPLRLNGRVKPAALATDIHPYAVISGHGMGPGPDGGLALLSRMLRLAGQKVVAPDDTRLSEQWRTSSAAGHTIWTRGWNVRIGSRRYPAGGPCAGDLGGPLWTKKSGTIYVEGVYLGSAVDAVTCGRAEDRSIFISVPSIRDWIDATLAGERPSVTEQYPGCALEHAPAPAADCDEVIADFPAAVLERSMGETWLVSAGDVDYFGFFGPFGPVATLPAELDGSCGANPRAPVCFGAALGCDGERCEENYQVAATAGLLRLEAFSPERVVGCAYGVELVQGEQKLCIPYARFDSDAQTVRSK